jgi:hypothetical protein
LDLRFKSYEIFKISAKIWACCQPLPMQQNLSKFPQRQFIQETLKFHQKLRFWFFSKKKLPYVEGAPKHVRTIWIVFSLRIFHMPFSMSKKAFVCEFQHTPLCKMTLFSRFHVLWIWDFFGMYLTHLGTRIWSPSIHTYSKKWLFWPPKLCYTPWAHGKKFFFSTLNLMIVQTVWNECIRFGERINIQVSYKILQSEVPKKSQILHNVLCFQQGLIWGSFGLNVAIDV